MPSHTHNATTHTHTHTHLDAEEMVVVDDTMTSSSSSSSDSSTMAGRRANLGEGSVVVELPRGDEGVLFGVITSWDADPTARPPPSRGRGGGYGGGRNGWEVVVVKWP